MALSHRRGHSIKDAQRLYALETRRHLSGEDSTVDDSLESATLHVLAAEHAGKECFTLGLSSFSISTCIGKTYFSTNGV